MPILSVIEFKSNPEYYTKEESGLKNNTEREFTKYGDKRERALKRFMKAPRKMQLQITNAVSGECFVRTISDVSFYNGRYTITWDVWKQIRLQFIEYMESKGYCERAGLTGMNRGDIHIDKKDWKKIIKQ